MKVLFVSPTGTDRPQLTGFLREALAQMGITEVEFSLVAYGTLPSGNEKEIELVLIDAIEDAELGRAVRAAAAWQPRPKVLVYYAGPRKPYIADSVKQLGANDCLMVLPESVANESLHKEFFLEQLQQEEMAEAAA